MYQFTVKGSFDYNVTVDKSGNNLIAKCSCKAGESNMLCKHLTRIFQGLDDDVIGNADKVKEIPVFIEDTYEGQLLFNLMSDEQELEKLKTHISKTKKLLGKILPI